MPQLKTRAEMIRDELRDLPVPSSKQPIVDYYQQTISDYQVWSRAGFMHFGLWRRWLNPLNRDSMLRAMNDHVFDKLDLNHDQRYEIGDFGCGVGAVSVDGCEKYPQHHWNAFTICPAQIAFGRELAKKGNVWPDQLSIEQGDFNDLSRPDSSLDAGFFLESLCHSSEPRATLDEIWRVLKPGAKLVVVDGMMNQHPALTPRWVNGLAKKVAENWAVPQFHPRPEFEIAFQEAGFEMLDRTEVGWQVAVSVAHSPILIALHSLKLMLTGRWSKWQRKHMVGCALGVLLGMLRKHFGYYIYTLRKI